MAVVIDASVAAAWCFSDERADAAEQVLAELTPHSGVVPAIFWYEIRNVLVVNERRGRIDPADSARFLMRLHGLSLLLDDRHDDETVMTLARKHTLSAYDSAYLETALRRGDSLATLDRNLAAAAAAEGLSVVHREQ